ncbi:MAG: hypothetical protein ABSF21_03410 [Dehalococcoidia bacterium]
MKVGIVIGIVIAVLALVVCLVPLKEVAYAVTVDYEDTETYYVTENYTEDVPLTFEANDYVREDSIEQHNRIVIGGVVIQDEVVEVPIEVACVKVKNTDDIAGNFTISFSGFDPMLGEPSLTTTLSLDIGEQKIAECPAESISTWSYQVNPSTKQVELQRQVEKQRTVTKQRQETRYKKVTVLDYLLHY